MISSFSAEVASQTRPGWLPGSVTNSRAASRRSLIRRSISAARSSTLCSRCNSAKVASILRSATTLAMLVIAIIASSNRMLP